MTTSRRSPGPSALRMTPKEHLREAYARECVTTTRVLSTYPEDRRDVRAYERSKTADPPWI